MQPSRRRFLALAGLAPAALLAARSAAAADAAACFDPATLPYNQKSRRRAVGYVDASTDPARRCGTCTFFTAAAAAGCGTCELLGAGPVSAGAVCGSFAAKAK